jgi:hypothetical protein
MALENPERLIRRESFADSSQVEAHSLLEEGDRLCAGIHFHPLIPSHLPGLFEAGGIGQFPLAASTPPKLNQRACCHIKGAAGFS